MPDQLREKRVELILQQLEELPTLPPVVIKVLQTVASDETSAHQVVELIASDQSLTTRILQLLHRADTGVPEEINSVDRAVVLLGFEAVRSMVLAVSVFHTMGLRPAVSRAAAHFNREEFWKHSIAVACCAELLAETPSRHQLRSAGVTPSKPLSAACCTIWAKSPSTPSSPKATPKSSRPPTYPPCPTSPSLERHINGIIGLDHMIAGKRLAERWNLPAAVRDSIWLHGQHPQALARGITNARMVNLITLADYHRPRAAHRLQRQLFTFDVSRRSPLRSTSASPQRRCNRSSRPPPNCVDPRIERRAGLLNLNVASTQELYQEAMKRANLELGRATSQLAIKNQPPGHPRANSSDSLGRFPKTAALRPDCPVHRNWSSPPIAQTARRALPPTPNRARRLPAVAPGAKLTPDGDHRQ